MDGVCQQLFAGAGFAQEQHGTCALRRPATLAFGLDGGGAGAHKAGKTVLGLAQERSLGTAAVALHSQLGPGVVGWDWTGLRLDDGRELMLYRLRRADGSPTEHSAGTLIEHDGTSRSLGLADFEFAPLSTWTSPASDARYPLRWRIAVPSAGIAGELAARMDACEIDGRTSTGTVYWEGPAVLSGSVAGSGYLELAGYAASLAARF